MDETYNALGFSSLAALVPEMQGPNPGNFRFFTTFFFLRNYLFFFEKILTTSKNTLEFKIASEKNIENHEFFSPGTSLTLELHALQR